MKHDSIKPETRVSIKDAKNRLTAIIRAVEGGQNVVLTRNGKPVADIVRYVRKGGIDLEGLRRWKEENGYTMVAGPIPEDFDDPLPEDFLIQPML
jgi:prevent-host-death family protein